MTHSVWRSGLVDLAYLRSHTEMEERAGNSISSPYCRLFLWECEFSESVWTKASLSSHFKNSSLSIQKSKCAASHVLPRTQISLNPVSDLQYGIPPLDNIFLSIGFSLVFILIVSGVESLILQWIKLSHSFKFCQTSLITTESQLENLFISFLLTTCI